MNPGNPSSPEPQNGTKPGKPDDLRMYKVNDLEGLQRWMVLHKTASPPEIIQALEHFGTQVDSMENDATDSNHDVQP